MREIERFVILQVVDTRWREHLESMDYLREGVHLRAMAQKDPLVEYRGEGHVMFEELSRIIREEVVLTLFHVEVQQDEARAGAPARRGAAGALLRARDLAGADAIAAAGGLAGGATAVAQPPVPAPGREGRGARRRPQRSVLVRLGQEVQALPRGVRHECRDGRAYRGFCPSRAVFLLPRFARILKPGTYAVSLPGDRS